MHVLVAKLAVILTHPVQMKILLDIQHLTTVWKSLVQPQNVFITKNQNAAPVMYL